ncbi:hypothetical protein LguiA_015971 [Lonicera macranthoides]
MLLLNPSSMDGSENPTGWGQMEVELITVSKSGALISCAAMTFFYVAILYSPTLILRLPPTSSFKTFMIRRFICATVSSLVSLFLCALVLPMRKWEVASIFGVYGIRPDYIWQAVVLPFLLTSLMYAGSMFLKCSMLLYSCKDHWSHGGDLSFRSMKMALQTFISSTISIASNVSAWRNYFVAPLTEELVFRACMIPLLLCGGFKTYTVIFLCPVFFSLAHLNHLLEFYTQCNGSLLRASMAVGFQLGYTVIFGSYASFLFIRTGHLTAPLSIVLDGRGGICSWDGGLHLASISTNFPILV